jgi:hypothetical protein
MAPLTAASPDKSSHLSSVRGYAGKPFHKHAARALRPSALIDERIEIFTLAEPRAGVRTGGQE